MSVHALAGFARGVAGAAEMADAAKRREAARNAPTDLAPETSSTPASRPNPPARGAIPDVPAEAQPPAPEPVVPASDPGFRPSRVDGRIAAGIRETAESLGLDPYDLGTVMSYETGGTFDPAQPGPTTQWGQHRGLIQFGEPQAKEHGVNWDDPIGSQLGKDGAVARYLRRAGVKPGMSLLDIYSAVNAGAPGRYGASDANNGGAPGTVADKVRDQMGGHRRKAEQLLRYYEIAEPGMRGASVTPRGVPPQA